MSYQEELEAIGRKRGLDLRRVEALAGWAAAQFDDPQRPAQVVEVALSPGDMTVYRILLVESGAPFNHTSQGFMEHPYGRPGEFTIVLLGDIGTSCPFDFAYDLNEFDGQRWVRPGTSEWTGVVMALFLNYVRRHLTSTPAVPLADQPKEG